MATPGKQKIHIREVAKKILQGRFPPLEAITNSLRGCYELASRPLRGPVEVVTTSLRGETQPTQGLKSSPLSHSVLKISFPLEKIQHMEPRSAQHHLPSRILGLKLPFHSRTCSRWRHSVPKIVTPLAFCSKMHFPFEEIQQWRHSRCNQND